MPLALMPIEMGPFCTSQAAISERNKSANHQSGYEDCFDTEFNNNNNSNNKNNLYVHLNKTYDIPESCQYNIKIN